jgi:hypothetical protein
MGMRYLTPAECQQLGRDKTNVVPYAIYGGKVYSLRLHECPQPGKVASIEPGIVVHGSDAYAELVKQADAAKAKISTAWGRN